MTNGHFLSKRILQFFVFLLCVVASLFIVGYRFCSADKDEFSNIKIRTENKKIAVSWNSSPGSNIESVIISVTGENFNKEYSISPDNHKFLFKTGKAGKLYNISVSACYKDGHTSDSISADRMFLDYDKLPNIPFIEINTSDSEKLSYDVIYAEDIGDEVMGGTIYNNNYVNASFKMSKSGRSDFASKAKIKIRGNTSAIFFEKKGYRLQFSEKHDLLGMGEEYADKEWILLYGGTDLKTYIGNYISLYCGMEWQPRTRFVNLMIDGDYKGCYILSEPVKKHEKKCNISDNGYIFECDPYWWNENDIYFRTKHQWDCFANTFKYPNITDKDDERIYNLKNYMDFIEDKIINQDKDLFDYIDADSFAAWILAKDILGVSDGAGANIYYYINDLQENNYKENKLKMGPLWDFDSVYEISDDWATQRVMHNFYFPYLLGNKKFYNLYIDKWSEISDNLNEDLSDYLDELYEKCGEDLDESIVLDNARWKIVNGLSMKEKIKTDKKWFLDRTKWLNEALLEGEEDVPR